MRVQDTYDTPRDPVIILLAHSDMDDEALVSIPGVYVPWFVETSYLANVRVQQETLSCLEAVF